MSAIDRMVTVYDRVPFTAAPTPEQAVAYVRRVLAPCGYVEGLHRSPAGIPTGNIVFMPSNGRGGGVLVPVRSDEQGAQYIAEACDALARIGAVRQPSEALRGMAEEKPL